MTSESLATVQRHALERALVDDTDARRYFALAGALEGGRADVTAENAATRPPADADTDSVLSAALLSLVVTPHLVEASTPSPATPAASSPSPWHPSHDATRRAVRRGARLALQWFDVSPERVAARARIPRADLVPSVE